MTENILQIAFITSTDARDKRSWSGTHYFIAKALERNVGNVDYLGPVDLPFHFFIGKTISFLSQKFFKKRFDYTHSIPVARSYAKVFSKKLNKKKYDLIFAPASSSKVAFLETKIPIIYISNSHLCKHD